MSYVTRPAAAPGCWGSKYQDGDIECSQCRYKDSCREEVLARTVSPHRTTLSVMRNYTPNVSVPPPPPPPTVNFASTQSAMVPLPSKPYYPPPVSHLPNPAVRVASPPLPTSAPQATTPQMNSAQHQ